MIARLDGRSFTRLTKVLCQFESPFDVRFRDLMVHTTQSLMTCSFKVLYAYTQSDEISLLFDMRELRYGRKHRKYNSTLAGEASARFSLALGQPVCFDCRISELPNPQLVIDYFRWRGEDAFRNALNAWCYWTLRKNNKSKQEATLKLHGLSRGQKNELLFQYGTNFNDVPGWQKRGIGLYWESYSKAARNPITDTEETSVRRRICVEFDLPTGDEYDMLVRTHTIPNAAIGAA
jgi:tRNA(His) 5'-end guanylyltransferase